MRRCKSVPFSCGRVEFLASRYDSTHKLVHSINTQDCLLDKFNYMSLLKQSHFRLLYVNLTVKAPALQNQAKRAQFKNAFAAVFTFGENASVKGADANAPD